MCYKVEAVKNAFKNYAKDYDYKTMLISIENVESISDMEKDILKMKHGQQLTFDEIAETLFLSKRQIYRKYESSLIAYYDFYNTQ